MHKAKLVAYVLLVASALTIAGGLAAAWHQGYRMYAVRTGSMAPTYPTGALIIDAPARSRTPVVGDVITFRTIDGLVTHRVHSREPQGLRTKGDANPAADTWLIAPHRVEGLVTWGLGGGGYALVFLQQPTGVAALMVLLVSVVLAWSIFFPPPRPVAPVGPTPTFG